MMNETQWYVEYNKSTLFVFLDLAVSSQCFLCVCVHGKVDFSELSPTAMP